MFSSWKGRYKTPHASSQYLFQTDYSSASSAQAIPTGLFGAPLNPNGDAPPLLNKFIRFLSQKGLNTQGIFQAQPNLDGEVQQVKKNLQKEQQLTENNENGQIASYTKNPHVVAELTKQYLAALPEPLFTFQLYDSFLFTQTISNEADRVWAYRFLLAFLPPGFRATVKLVLTLLYRTTMSYENSRMDAKALAEVFGPYFLRPDEEFFYMKDDQATIVDILTLLIQECEAVLKTVTTSLRTSQATPSVFPIGTLSGSVGVDLSSSTSIQQPSLDRVVTELSETHSHPLAMPSTSPPKTAKPAAQQRTTLLLDTDIDQDQPPPIPPKRLTPQNTQQRSLQLPSHIAEQAAQQAHQHNLQSLVAQSPSTPHSLSISPSSSGTTSPLTLSPFSTTLTPTLLSPPLTPFAVTPLTSEDTVYTTRPHLADNFTLSPQITSTNLSPPRHNTSPIPPTTPTTQVISPRHNTLPSPRTPLPNIPSPGTSPRRSESLARSTSNTSPALLDQPNHTGDTSEPMSSTLTLSPSIEAISAPNAKLDKLRASVANILDTQVTPKLLDMLRNIVCADSQNAAIVGSRTLLETKKTLMDTMASQLSVSKEEVATFIAQNPRTPIPLPTGELAPQTDDPKILKLQTAASNAMEQILDMVHYLKVKLVERDDGKMAVAIGHVVKTIKTSLDTQQPPTSGLSRSPSVAVNPGVFASGSALLPEPAVQSPTHASHPPVPQKPLPPAPTLHSPTSVPQSPRDAVLLSADKHVREAHEKLARTLAIANEGNHTALVEAARGVRFAKQQLTEMLATRNLPEIPDYKVDLVEGEDQTAVLRRALVATVQKVGDQINVLQNHIHESMFLDPRPVENCFALVVRALIDM